MYLPFTQALNRALSDLSKIQVNGLPKFDAHIVFVLCDKVVSSDRNSPGTLFKPDLAVISLEDAWKFHKLDESGDVQSISQFINKTAQGSPSGSISWKTILSVVEMKRRGGSLPWPQLEEFGRQDKQVSVMEDADRRLDEELEASQPTTRKVNAFPNGVR